MPCNNQLPPKESALFKRIVKCYEQKQYKNGLKFAKQILSKPEYSEHGETLAMKGLILNCMGKKEDAYSDVRKGLRNDLRSHVCWHVYGLLQRSDRKYEEAIKCYTNALKWDKDNLQILRDLSLLQIQMRDLEGYRDTRYQLLVLKPTQRVSWIGYALAHHLLGNYEQALKILDEFIKTQTPKEYDFEHSELLLYYNQILQEAGQHTEALSHLRSNSMQIADTHTFSEFEADILLRLDKLSAAAEKYRALIERNPEHLEYYTQLAKCLHPFCEDRSEQVGICEEYIQKFPYALTPKREALVAAVDREFVTRVDAYLRHGLHKGTPPLFLTLKKLYNDPIKVAAIEKLCCNYVYSLNTFSKFSQEDTEDEPPTTLLWTNYFLAKHYNHLGQSMLALEHVNKALSDVPTLIELYELKGKIYRKAGDIHEAVHWMDEAQDLDTADRFINSRCVKYLLKANRVSDAEQLCMKFTREGVAAAESLNEMQCMWFQTACAAAFIRLGQFGDALKKCHEIYRHFTEMTEDQFDFHSYCMRKTTLRAYVDLLRLETRLREHDFYVKAATMAIQIYVELYDHPYTEKENRPNDGEEESSELKKQRRKARRQQRKEEQRKEEERKRQQEQQKKDREDLDGPVLKALLPEDLVKASEPLEEAITFLKPLLLFASDHIETHTLAYEVFSRKNKPMLMLRAITQGCQQNGQDDPYFHACIVHFLSKPLSLEPPINHVFNEQCLSLGYDMKHFGTELATSVNEQFLQRNLNSLGTIRGLPHVYAYAKAAYILDPSRSPEVLSLLINFDVVKSKATLPQCIDTQNGLARGMLGQCSEEVVDEFKRRCHDKYPLAVAFKSPEAPQCNGDVVEVDDVAMAMQRAALTTEQIGENPIFGASVSCDL